MPPSLPPPPALPSPPPIPEPPEPPDFRIVSTWPADDVVALYESAGWWREGAAGRAAIPAMIAGSFCFAVAVEAGRAVAMGRVISDGVSDGYVQDVVVLPACRGRGIGREMIALLARTCVSRGLVWIGLVAEPGTTVFYERLGFREMKGFVPMRLPTEGQP